MKNKIKNGQVAFRKDPAQNGVLVWSIIDSYLEKERNPGKKCPIYTF